MGEKQPPKPMTPDRAKALCKELRDAIEEFIPDGPARVIALYMLDRTEAHMLLAIKQGKRKPRA